MTELCIYVMHRLAVQFSLFFGNEREGILITIASRAGK